MRVELINTYSVGLPTSQGRKAGFLRNLITHLLKLTNS